MKNVHDHIRGHIEYVKGQPRHIREKVALAAAASCTALIALVWLAGSLSAGTFAIKSQPFSDGSELVATPAGSGGERNNGLAGAAAALPGGEQEVKDTSAHIEIVDATPPAREEEKAEQTIIPF